MNIVLATDNCFAQHCAVAIRSVLDHNKDVEFYILTEGLSEENQHKLREVVGNVPLSFCIVDSDAVKDFPMPETVMGGISLATYYRLFITRLLPMTVKRVIYLDCDIVVRASLLDMWNVNMDGKALAAVYYPDCPSTRRNCKRLGLQEDVGYFNAGVLLVNLEYWRDHDLQKQYFDYIRNYRERIFFHDQDVLNVVIGTETIALSWRYNVMSNELELIKEQVLYNLSSSGNRENAEKINNILSLEKVEPVIVHYSYRLKPWEFGCRNPYKNEYRRLLKKTPYAGAPLQFSWRAFYELWIKPVIIVPILKLIKR